MNLDSWGDHSVADYSKKDLRALAATVEILMLRASRASLDAYAKGLTPQELRLNANTLPEAVAEAVGSGTASWGDLPIELIPTGESYLTAVDLWGRGVRIKLSECKPLTGAVDPLCLMSVNGIGWLEEVTQ